MAGEFKIPSHVSEKCRSMMRGILNKDPETRFTIDNIREHDYITGHHIEPIVQGIITGVNEIPIDDNTLKIICETFGFDIATSRTMISNNKHNNITATYYLQLI